MALKSEALAELEKVATGVLEGIVDRGDIPQDRATVAGAAVNAFFALLDTYLAGGTKLSLELDALISNLLNTEDPFVRVLSLEQRTTLFTALNMLRKQKGKHHAAVQSEAEGT